MFSDDVCSSNGHFTFFGHGNWSILFLEICVSHNFINVVKLDIFVFASIRVLFVP